MPLAPATPAPDALNDLLERSGLKPGGTPVFLNFFRIDCPWCVMELPRLAQTYLRRQGLGVHVVGVAGGSDSAERIAAFVGEKGWSYPVVTDADLAWHHVFEITRVPAVVMVNSQGLVERTYEGATEQLVGILEQTIFAAAHNSEPPEYDMVGNGCAP